MKINAKFIFKVVAIVSIPLTGYLASKGSKWYQEGVDELNLKKPEADISTADKALVVAKSYALAAVSGAAGVGSVLAMDHISMGQLTAGGALVAANKQLIKKKGEQLESYKEAIMRKLGLEKAEEIEKTAEGICLEKSYVGDLVTDEVLHMFHIDWLGFDLYFDLTMAEAMAATGDINRELFDLTSGSGLYTMDRFLSMISRPDLITDDIAKRGWCEEALRHDCECYWLPFQFKKMLDENGKDTDIIDIWTPWKPNVDIEEYRKMLEEEEGGDLMDV